MSADRNRMARAGDYVLGLMDEAERERAERDLEIDPAFRSAVLELAGRMHVFDRSALPTGQPEEQWQQIARHIAGLPQMHPAQPGSSRQAKPVIGTSPQPIGKGLHATGDWRGFVIALGLLAAFALGYLAGRL